jgi:hypothetical protein
VMHKQKHTEKYRLHGLTHCSGLKGVGRGIVGKKVFWGQKLAGDFEIKENEALF